MPDNEKQFEQDIESFLISPLAAGRKLLTQAIEPLWTPAWRWTLEP